MKNSGKRCLATLLAVVLLLNVNVVSYASENSEQENEYSESNAVSWQRQKDNVINESYELKEKKGWNEEEGNKYYCDESGNRVVGLKKIDDKTYFFDEQGYMKTGWKTVEEHEYYFDIDSGVRYEDQICEIDGIEYEFDAEGNAKELKKDENKQNGNDNVEEEETEGIINETEKQSDLNGKVALPLKEQAVFKGWVEESDNTYYYDVNGNKVTGIHKIGRKLYYFEEKNSSGVLVKANWVMVNNKRYYAMPDGSLKIGWLSFGDEYYYCGEDGAIVCGKQKIDGNWYYFDEKGVRQTGWIEMGGEKYYGLPDGSLRVGWLSFGSTRYYCDDNAKVVTGMYSVNGIIYQFDSNGKLVLVKQGWHESNGEKYYGMPDGTYRVGWLSFGNTYYYCGEDGAIVYGKQKIDGKWYYFDKNGVRQTGWIEKEGEKYYGMPDGSLREGWLSFGNTYYYCGKDGAIVYGKQKIDGKWYYFDENGIRQIGWIETEDGKYYGLPDGSLREGWLSFGDTYYYCEKDGIIVCGKHKIGGKWYYFDENGVRQTGWIETEDGKSYGMPDGSLREGWLSFGDTYYYCDNTGIVVIDDFAIDGILYTFNKNGVMKKKKGWGEYQGNKYYFNPETGFPYKGWVTFGNTYYYADNRGIMVKGWYYISGYYYYFYPDTCIMARNTTIDGYKIGADGRREKTGWYYENGYKFYYKNGVKQLDLDGILPRQSSYWIKVNRTTCSVTVYAKDGANGYIIPVKRFACSVGLPSTPTPTGTYYTPAKYRWHTLMGPSYGQYCTRIVGGVLFHSVAGYNMTSYNIKAKDYNKLGQPASHGCVRLTVRDAKWIYDNCPLNTKVTIYDSSDPGPLGKPATIKIPAGQNWDPTDPNI